MFGLSDGGALVTTVASYATPAGNEIDRRARHPAPPLCRVRVGGAAIRRRRVVDVGDVPAPRRAATCHRQGVAPDEGRLFLTEALGSGFVEGDVKQTRFDRPFECTEKLELDGQAKAAAPVGGTFSPSQPTAAPKLRTL